LVPNEARLESQDMKTPQLRNLYKKTGFADLVGAVNKRGTGYTHDGAIDDIFQFLKFPGFNFGPETTTANANRRDVKAFLLAFDTGTAPAVGYQVTFDGTPDVLAQSRVDTLKDQAALDYCDLVARGRVGGVGRGWLYQGGDQWKPDVSALPNITTAELIAEAGVGAEVTITGVPEGS